MDQKTIDKLVAIIGPIQAYHKHEVHGIENVPDKGRCLLVANHSLATYDLSMLAKAIYDHNGRVPRSLMDRWFFVVPQIAEIMASLGAIQGRPDAAADLLANGEILTVAPGGMRESLRPASERYQIIWDKRKGFVKLAIKTATPIILAACPHADDIFDVYSSKLTWFLYEHFKVPFVPFRGIGPTPIPRPVKLIHFLSKPIHPPKMKEDEDEFAKQVNTFHAKIVKAMQELIGEAIAYRPKDE